MPPLVAPLVPTLPEVDPEVDPDVAPEVLPEVPVPVVPELDIDGFTEDVVPVVVRLVELAVAEPPATTGGAMPLRMKTSHWAVVFQVFVVLSRHWSRSWVLLGSYGSVLVEVVPDITEFDEGIVAEGAALVEGCDHAGAASAAPSTVARAESLREFFMAVFSVVAEEVRLPGALAVRHDRCAFRRPPLAYIMSGARATRKPGRSRRHR